MFMKNINYRISTAPAVNNISSGKLGKSAMDSNILKANFLTRISHELRTPLNSIKGAIHYLQNSERPAPSQEREFYDIISSETGNLASIVESLLDFLRTEQDAKKTVMQVFLELTAEFLNLEICSVMLNNNSTRELAIVGSIGLNKDIVRKARIKVGDPIAGWVALKGEPLLIKNIEQAPFFKRNSIPQYNTKSLLSMPLKFRDRVIGVVNMNNKKTAASFTERDLKLASMFTDRISRVAGTLYAGDYL